MELFVPRFEALFHFPFVPRLGAQLLQSPKSLKKTHKTSSHSIDYVGKNPGHREILMSSPLITDQSPYFPRYFPEAFRRWILPDPNKTKSIPDWLQE